MTTQTLEQLKARAYDILAAMQQLQNELKNVNQEIAKMSSPKSNGSYPIE